MRWLKLGAVSVNQTPLDWTGNEIRIREALEAARAADVGLVVFPELCLTGYGCEDAFFMPSVVEAAEHMVARLAPHTAGLAAVLGVPVRWEGNLYNAACLLVDGEVRALVPKQNLAGDGIHYEPRWFKPWPEGEVTTHPYAGATCTLGDVVVQVGDVRVGFEICEDAWSPKRTSIAAGARHADVIVSPSASHFAFGKHAVRERIVREASRAQHCAYVYANLLGNEAGRVVYDGGGMIAQGGDLRAAATRFSFLPWHLTTASVDVSAIAAARTRNPNWPRTPGSDAVQVAFQLPEARPVPAAEPAPDAFDKPEEFTRAVALSLFDYARKSRSRGFVVSLSGGADSAAVAVLCHAAWTFAADALGESAARAALAIPADADAMEHVLLCVYQGTRNSSDATRNAAEGLAQALGAGFSDWDVDDLVTGYTERAAATLGRALTWERDDLALQNIQARARAPGVWMLANLRGALLLATSNRSEAAVGYATMDGDTCGGVSPIAGIDKAYLRAWLRWMETEGPQGMGPTPALAAINVQAPTAELRPGEAKQTDEEDLMPYDVLDRIERHAIGDKHGPRSCYTLLGADFPEASAQQRLAWVERFFQLWSRNQWKRERYAPSFHLDDKNLDPKTWCRFPILSGGFTVELAALRDEVLP